MTPAPATVSIPPRAFRKGPKQAPRATVEAPGASVTVTFLFGARIEIRGVCGVPTDAVAQYVEMLERGLQEQARQARLAAITLVPPASIGEALLDAVSDDDSNEQHDPHCTDPCCVSDDELDDDLFCADEGHQVLTSGAAYYGTTGGAW